MASRRKKMWLAAGATAFLVAAVLATPLPYDGNGQVTPENYQRIKEDMTCEQVSALLGSPRNVAPPERVRFLGISWQTTCETHYYLGKRDKRSYRPVITLCFSNGSKVVEKRYGAAYDPSPQQKMWEFIAQELLP
jgi:outer membrane protein assembly factor BamE (lipoprotein component of BamABCDE complex)